MPPEPKPPPCSWCHWPVKLVPDTDGAVQAAAAPSSDAGDPPVVRRCTNPWCPTRRPGFGVAP